MAVKLLGAILYIFVYIKHKPKQVDRGMVPSTRHKTSKISLAHAKKEKVGVVLTRKDQSPNDVVVRISGDTASYIMYVKIDRFTDGIDLRTHGERISKGDT